MSETTAETKPEPTATEKKFASTATVVTHDTVEAYKVKKLFPNAATEAPAENSLAEVAKAKAEDLKTEPTKVEEVKDEAEKAKQDALDKRFSKLTKQREDAKREAEEERKKREALEARIAELEKGKAPEVKKDPAAKPMPEQFEDAFKYAEALADWTTKQALKQRDTEDAERRATAEREAVAAEWKKRQESFVKVTPDYAEVLEESDVKVSDQVRDVILESDVGPQMLYHLALHPELAEEIADMTVAKALRRLGKLEAELEKKVEKDENKTVTEEIKKPEGKAVQISRAPAPITPIKIAGSASDLPIDANGNFTGTHKQYKELRKAGKI